MKKSKWKQLGILMMIVSILAGNLAGISAFANADEDPVKTTTENPPVGVLMGYQPSSEKQIDGYRIEHYGWIGGEFSRLVYTYKYTDCCKRTLREMDGCSGLPKCKD